MRENDYSACNKMCSFGLKKQENPLTVWPI